MKFDEIMKIIKDLSYSQGFYGRLLRNIEELDEEEKENLKEVLEKKNFKDSLDLIMFLEG